MPRVANYQDIQHRNLTRIFNFGNLNPDNFQRGSSLFVYEFYLILRFLWFRFDGHNWHMARAANFFALEVTHFNQGGIQSTEELKRMKVVFTRVRDLSVANFFIGLEDIINLWLGFTRSGMRFRNTWTVRTANDAQGDYLITSLVAPPVAGPADGNGAPAAPAPGVASTFLEHFLDFITSPRYVKHIWRYNLATISPVDQGAFNVNAPNGPAAWQPIWTGLKDVIKRMGPFMLQHMLKGRQRRWSESKLHDKFAATMDLTCAMPPPPNVVDQLFIGPGGYRAPQYGQILFNAQDLPATNHADITDVVFNAAWNNATNW